MIRLVGSRHCGACNRPGAVSNTFTNGIGWRELCDRCGDAPVLLPCMRFTPAPPALSAVVQ